MTIFGSGGAAVRLCSSQRSAARLSKDTAKDGMADQNQLVGLFIFGIGCQVLDIE
jgi:hypothetical protein